MAITAQNIGAENYIRARKSMWYGMGFALAISFLFWIWAQVNPQSMMLLFTDDQDIIAVGVLFLRSCSYDYIFVTIVFCLNGYLNGQSKTIWTMVSCCFGALCFRIPLVCFFATYYTDDMGKLGAIASMISCIMACYTLVYVLYGGKKYATEKQKIVSDR